MSMRVAGGGRRRPDAALPPPRRRAGAGCGVDLPPRAVAAPVCGPLLRRRRRHGAHAPHPGERRLCEKP